MFSCVVQRAVAAMRSVLRDFDFHVGKVHLVLTPFLLRVSAVGHPARRGVKASRAVQGHCRAFHVATVKVDSSFIWLASRSRPPAPHPNTVVTSLQPGCFCVRSPLYFLGSYPSIVALLAWQIDFAEKLFQPFRRCRSAVALWIFFGSYAVFLISFRSVFEGKSALDPR